jgi:hypothetical protein
MEKYKELFELSKYAFDEELSRGYRIDDKASKYFSVLTFIIGIYMYFVKFAIKDCVPINNVLKLVILIFTALLLVFLYVTWLFLFKVLKIGNYFKIPIDIEFYQKNDLPSIYLAMSKGMKTKMLENRKKGDRKALFIKWSYRLISCDMCLIIFLILLYSIKLAR